MGMSFSLNLSSTPTQRVDPSILYDALVIGAGPAGLNAALYAKRKGLNVGILAERIGGQVLDTPMVENYLGLNQLSGESLMKKYEDHVREYEVPISDEIRVERVSLGEYKEVHGNDGHVYRAHTLILATGTMPRKLGVKGEKELYGRGVSYCAICDGSFYSGKTVIVVGGGNAAVGAAVDLARIAKTVKIVQRSGFRADKVLLDRLHDQLNVEILLQTGITEILGETVVEGVMATDRLTGVVHRLDADGIFVEIGHIPKTGCLNGLLEVDEQGEIVVGPQGETSVPGVFAAGDVTNGPFKQIIIAAADGAKAALKANEYMNRLKSESHGMAMIQ